MSHCGKDLAVILAEVNLFNANTFMSHTRTVSFPQIVTQHCLAAIMWSSALFASCFFV